jgi:hypothetical protein
MLKVSGCHSFAGGFCFLAVFAFSHLYCRPTLYGKNGAYWTFVLK